MPKNESETKIVEENQNIETKPEALAATVVGEIKEEKQKGLLGVLIFFLVILVAVFGLPYVTEYIKELRENKTPTKVKDDSNKSDANDDIVENEMVPINSENVIAGKLIFNNMKIISNNGYYLNLDISTESPTGISLTGDYFIELYSSGQMLIERIRLIDARGVTSDRSITASLKVSQNSYTDTSLIKIAQLSPDAYPEVNLGADANNNQRLTCTSGNHKLIYSFNDYKLYQIEDIYTYSRSENPDYDTLLITKMGEASNLSSELGIISTVVVGENSFVFNTVTDLNAANPHQVTTKHYYKLNTKAKIISFELESSGYYCKAD